MQRNDENIERLYELIGKRLDESISDLENSELTALLHNSKDYQAIFDQTKKLWDQPTVAEQDGSASMETLDIDLESAWNTMNDRILLDKIDDNHAKMEAENAEISSEESNASPTETGSEEESDNVVPISPSRRIPLSMSKTAKYSLAASVLFGIALLIFFQFDAQKDASYLLSKSAGLGETNFIQLTDSTKVSLNENSNLRYPETFTSEDKTREVELTGIAFFDVARNEAQPFIIHTKTVDVKVLGTSFQVNSSKTEDVNVQVVSGTVQVSSVQNPNLMVTLEKGEAASFSVKEGGFTKSKTKSRTLFWTTKTLVFDKTSVEEVVEVINECYASNLIIKSEGIKQCKLTATFENESLDNVLEIISTALKIEVTKADNAYHLSGDNGCQ